MSPYSNSSLASMVSFCKNIWRGSLMLMFGLLIMTSDVHSQGDTFRRFEYKLSFVGPHLVLKDGTVPFWEHSGSAIASDESVRVTPSLKSKKGAIWCKENVSHEHWQVEVHFRVSGRGRVGADGLAVWYTSSKGQEGPVFGSNDKWNGLGVFFDSFDNDNQHNNPYIMAMVNDGTKEYDHEADGSNQQLGGCLRDFRNRPYPVKVRIEYYKKALTIHFHNGLTNNDEDFEMCTRIENVVLPENGFFGVSAATGGLADDHDVLAFLTHSLTPLQESEEKTTVPEVERKKMEKEYEEYREKLEKAKEEYKKDHPKGKVEVDEDKVFESQDVRELRLIYEGQNDIARLLKSSLGKLDEIVGRQERQLSMLTMISQNNNGQRQGSTLAEKRDVDAVSNTQKQMFADLKDLKHLVNEASSKISNFKAPEVSGVSREMSSKMESLQSDLKLLASQIGNLSSQSSSGVTLTHLVLFLVLHLAAVVGCLVFKASREAALKKLY